MCSYGLHLLVTTPPPPPISVTCWPLLTLACQAYVSVPMCFYLWLMENLDFISQLSCMRTSVCVWLYCIWATLWYNNLLDWTSEALKHKTCHISQSCSCSVVRTMGLSRLILKVLSSSAIRSRATWMTDTTLGSTYTCGRMGPELITYSELYLQALM